MFHRDPNRPPDTSKWLENKSRSMPPEIKRSKVLASKWSSVKFCAWLIDDMKAGPVIGLVPLAGDATATILITILTYHYYWSFLSALDKQIQLESAEDPELLQMYRKIKMKHNKGIATAIVMKALVGLIPFVGDYIGMMYYKPSTLASENIGHIVIKLYGYDAEPEKQLWHFKMPQRPQPAATNHQQGYPQYSAQQTSGVQYGNSAVRRPGYAASSKSSAKSGGHRRKRKH